VFAMNFMIAQFFSIVMQDNILHPYLYQFLNQKSHNLLLNDYPLLDKFWSWYLKIVILINQLLIL